LSRKTEIQVGATVIVSLVVLIAGVAWLKEWTFQHDTHVYRISFPQVGGLAASDEVHVNGIRKGEVKAMRLVDDYVEVALQLEREVVLTTDSRVAIRNVGLMGERVIAVDLRTTGRRYDEKELITGIYEPGMGEVMGSLGSTVDAVNTLSATLGKLATSISSEGKLQSTIHNFSETSEELRLAVSENRALLRSTMENFAAASKTAKTLTTDREAELRKSLEHFSSAAERLDHLTGRLDSLRMVVQRLATKVDRGDGTLGKLVNDERLYTELNASVTSLRALIEDVKANPKKYFKVSVF
jgi:phospholipid/cholesterol/gamma-HCH transport system substrate-binding protein